MYMCRTFQNAHVCVNNKQTQKKVRRLSEENLAAAVEIETASYPEDEAATPENMRFRRANAGEFFLEATVNSVS